MVTLPIDQSNHSQQRVNTNGSLADVFFRYLSQVFLSVRVECLHHFFIVNKH